MRWLSVREDLGINNIDTCLGYALSKNRRCRNPISFTEKEWACATFKRISESGIQREQLIDDHLDEDVFEELAELLLCSLHYWDQKHSLITGWKQRALARERERRLQEARASENTVETITTMFESVGLAAQRTILERITSSTGVDASRTGAASTSNRHSTSSQTHVPGSRDSHYSYRSDLVRQQVHNAHLHEGKSSSVGRSSPPASDPTPRGSYDNKRSQFLKDLEPFCSICLDSFEDTHNISRCRGCLKKFHGGCITTWLQQCLDTDMNESCPHW